MQWEYAFGFLLAGWAYLLAAAGVLALTGVPRGRRLALAHAFPVALWAALSLTPDGGGYIKMNWADVAFTFPAMLAAHTIPNPTYASACEVSYWDLARRGYDASPTRLLELSDGSVLVAATAHRSDPDSDAPTGFALGRGCVNADDVVAGPGVTFSYAWRAPPATPRDLMF